MGKILYNIVTSQSEGYQLVKGDCFTEFNTLSVFKETMAEVAPKMMHFEVLSERKGNSSRCEGLVKCSFNIGITSQPFFIYLTEIEGGGRENLPNEHRIQFRPHSNWEPDLSRFELAKRFVSSDDKSSKEIYLIGIYKRALEDKDVLFVGVHPNWIANGEIETNATTSKSFQINIKKIAEAYKLGISVYEKSDKQRAICFTPDNLFWYMTNRDTLHLSELNIVENLIGDKRRKYYNIDQPTSRQIIYYGAPGTGKSFEVNEQTKGHSTVRTTFHPDTDYSTFVGAYKPVMTTEDVRVVPVVIGEGGVVFNKDEGSRKGLQEQRITYKFVRQAFLKAYLSAWKKYAEAGGNDVELQFLVIEEINRGNCAQIFGDLFQLLDREDNGFSKYPIEADSDLTREINAAFNEEENGEYRLADECKINVEGAIDKYTSSTGHTLSEDIQEGRVLLLPSNLYIWATMNTADQSLFPIDSAFKRRWTWKYTKIAQGFERTNNGEYKKAPDGKRIPLGWKIEGTDYSLDWWTFVQAINSAIGQEGSSEDKKLGYFFCKPDNGDNISEETFVGKVMFYLWNDVFKDSETGLFKVNDEEPAFDTFYTENEDGFTVVDSRAVKKFLINLLGDKADKIESKETVPNEDNGNVSSDSSEAAEIIEE